MAPESVALELFSAQEVEHFHNHTNDLAAMRARVDGLAIRNQADATALHNSLAEAKRCAAHVEMIRKDQVGPLNDQVRAINAAWRPLTDGLAAFELAVKKKLLAWTQAERERIAREQEAARKAQAEAERRQAEALAKAEAAKNSKTREKALAQANVAGQDLMQARVAEPMDAPTGFRTDHGTTSTREVWTFKVLDAAQVPREFLVVDEKAIRRAVLAGQREIPGVSIYAEEQLAVRVQ